MVVPCFHASILPSFFLLGMCAAFPAPQVGRVLDLAPLCSSPGGDGTSSTERVPWEFTRFLSQSVRFVSPPSLLPPMPATAVPPGGILWSPSARASSSFGNWAPLDDVVMGGASKSVFSRDGYWSGTVTEANSGGFVGIRTLPLGRKSRALDLSGCSGLEITLSVPDNTDMKRRFKFVVRDSTDFNGVCWTSSFEIDPSKLKNAGGWAMSLRKDTTVGEIGDESKKSQCTTIKVPFDKQVPTIFANTIQGKTFKKNNVVGLQLAYSKFEYDGGLNPNFSTGDFAIRVEKIRSY